ncbi:MAG TPA: histidine--tRNA ligase [Treponemataceae bacterium]|nr:histidine--tRNA ligase [Treponemataceae bacterium]
MSSLIQPRVLKGFRDFLPQTEIRRSQLIEKLTDSFQSYGFVPIDTPVLEYSEILLRKSDGETEKQVFRFKDNGKRDVALRFDLTVPFARFIAEHKNELYFPFKRYHIAKVWRGEKPQAGRYREFVQCDFDTVGSDTAAADFEILSLIKHALSAIGVNKITIKISHRGIFNAFLANQKLSNKSEDILRTVDKLEKIGKQEVKNQLYEYTQSNVTSDLILSYIAGKDSFESTLSLMAEMAGAKYDKNKPVNNAAKAVERLQDIRAMMVAANIQDTYILDPSITRGLDYYTGVVCETFLNDLPSIGSICSGGRYDNLAGLYMKEQISGVGSSIGLDRLIAGLDTLGMYKTKGSFLDVEIFNKDNELASYYQKIASELRMKNINVEVYTDNRNMKQQFKLTTAKSIPWGILIEKDQKDQNVLTLRNLNTREQFDNISLDRASDIILKHRTADS